MTLRFVALANMMTRATGISLALLVLTCVACSLNAHAQSSVPIKLSWNAPPGCSSTAEVLARVRSLAGESSAMVQSLKAVATITQQEDGQFKLKLVVHSGKLVGERIILGHTCEDLAGATAINLALLLSSQETSSDNKSTRSASPPITTAPASNSPSRSSLQSTSSSNEQADVDSPLELNATTSPEHIDDEAASAPSDALDEVVEPAQEPERKTAETAATPRSWKGLLGLPLVSLGLGPLPNPSLGLTATGGILVGKWRVLVEGSGWLRQTYKSADQPDVGAKMDRVQAALRGCYAALSGQFEISPCVRVSVQHLWARGTGDRVTPQLARSTWIAVGAGVQARWHIASRLSLLGGLDVEFQASRPRISIDGLGSLGQLSPYAVTMFLGPEWIL